MQPDSPRDDSPPPNPAEDTFRLVHRYQAGDRSALDELSERYYPRILRLVRVRLWSRLGAWTDSEDVAHDVFLRVVRGLETFERRDDARFIDWVSKLVSNEIASQARRVRPVGSLDADGSGSGGGTGGPPASSTGLTTRFARNEEELLVDRCLAELAPDEREVILLREYAGGSWASVAADLGRPSVGAAQQLYQRARRSLKERLERHGLAD